MHNTFVSTSPLWFHLILAFSCSATQLSYAVSGNDLTNKCNLFPEYLRQLICSWPHQPISYSFTFQKEGYTGKTKATKNEVKLLK